MPFIKIRFLFSLAFLMVNLLYAQVGKEQYQEIKAFQKDLNVQFADPEDSPLTPEDLDSFEELEFFSINLNYRIDAKFVRTPDQKPFKMATSTKRKPEYVKYGEAHFVIGDSSFVLTLYQSLSLKKEEEYSNYLFLPFKDYTNGFGSYGGGRYIDLEIPEGDIITLDFNQAYNPYCAYSDRYSCPLVPDENHLEVEIPAGVKNWDH